MAEILTPAPSRWVALTRKLRWALLFVVVLLAVVAVVLPIHTLAAWRSDYVWFGRPLLWLDNMSSPALDLTHVVLFAGITWALSVLWPSVVWWRIALPLLALAVVTELVQFWVPGRTPRLDDGLVDMLGVAVGLTLALPVRWIARGR